MVIKPRLLTLSPHRIAGGYLAFGVLWILLSDRFVFLIAESRATFAQLQTVKGWFFVGGSAVLIFGLTRTREAQIESTQTRLSQATQELQVLHRVFRHNIRNDLNVVEGRIAMVLDAIEDTRFTDWLDTAHGATERILDTSEKLQIIEHATLRPSDLGTVDVVDVIQSECELIKSAHPDVTIETDLPEAATVPGDQSLRYVFRELFENAMKHHHLPEDQRRISISGEYSISEVTIRIADNGPGIPDENLTALRSGEETQLSHMLGVGLWLVKWLCSFYGGAVSFALDNSDGTEVTISLPPASPIERLTTLVGDGGQNQSSA